MPNPCLCLSALGFLLFLWLSVQFYSWMPDRGGIAQPFKEAPVGGRALRAFSSNKLRPKKKKAPLHSRDKNSPAGFCRRQEAGAAWLRTRAALLTHPHVNHHPRVRSSNLPPRQLVLHCLPIICLSIYIYIHPSILHLCAYSSVYASIHPPIWRSSITIRVFLTSSFQIWKLCYVNCLMLIRKAIHL